MLLLALYFRLGPPFWPSVASCTCLQVGFLSPAVFLVCFVSCHSVPIHPSSTSVIAHAHCVTRVSAVTTCNPRGVTRNQWRLRRPRCVTHLRIASGTLIWPLGAQADVQTNVPLILRPFVYTWTWNVPRRWLWLISGATYTTGTRAVKFKTPHGPSGREERLVVYWHSVTDIATNPQMRMILAKMV